jgi:4-hydroxy-tetrahydrodipicolinate reductase
MNIGLFGYGKMGKMLEQIGQQRGHSIVAKVDVDTTNINYDTIDVAIDFSTPEAAFKNITNCFDHKIPVVCGTTGWLHKYEEAVAHCQQKEAAFIYASNFSLGVNLFFELNKKLARMISDISDYAVSMEEIHHTQKLDAPSGTAITLAEDIIENSGYKNWSTQKAMGGEIPITSKRIGNTPGTHTISYDSDVDSIQIQHTAHNREGFALGAIIASEWLQGKKGVFTMNDVLKL